MAISRAANFKDKGAMVRRADPRALGRTICFTGRSRNHGSEPRPRSRWNMRQPCLVMQCVSSTKGGWRVAVVTRTVTQLVVWCEQVSGQGQTPGIFPGDWQCPQE